MKNYYTRTATFELDEYSNSTDTMMYCIISKYNAFRMWEYQSTPEKQAEFRVIHEKIRELLELLN